MARHHSLIELCSTLISSIDECDQSQFNRNGRRRSQKWYTPTYAKVSCLIGNVARDAGLSNL